MDPTAHQPHSAAVPQPPPPAPAQDPPASVAHYAVRLPTFWPSNPAVWFIQADCQFALAGITTQISKFRYVVSALPQEVAADVIDVLTHPPPDAPYDALRNAILDRTMASERQRLQQLLSAEELGDRRPSQLLRHMQSLLADRASTFDAALLKQLFLQRLPTNVQMILASASTLPLPDLAAHADRIMEVATPPLCALAPIPPASATHHPAVAAATPGPSHSTDPLTRLQADVDHLTALVAAALPKSHPQRRRRSSRARSPRRSPSPSTSSTPGVCWYHARFGDAAQRCTRPCSWPGNAFGDR